MNQLKAYFSQSSCLDYNTVWRWHFYAGLFCIPFVVLLAVTGTIYLFKPQFEAYQNSAYDHLANGQPASLASAQVQAALAAVPNTAFSAYQLPKTPPAAAQVMLLKGDDLFRVWVNPFNLQILKIVREDDRLMNWIHHLHGQLLLGDRGSNIVELASSWAIVMMITGLFLWWPRNLKSVAGVLYPRLGTSTVIKNGKPVKSRLFWRDLHAVFGFWIAFFVLFLLISGLPWAKSWGSLLKEVRKFSTPEIVKTQQDWTTGRSSELAMRQLIKPASDDEHAQHHHSHSESQQKQDLSSLNEMASNINALNLAYPVIVSAPSKKSPQWAGKSDAQNRPLRVSIELDSMTGNIVNRKNFADKALLDRVIGYGIAVHEGQLFGWFNQLLGLFTALGLIIVSISGTVMWWRRRQIKQLGAPTAQTKANTRMPLAVLSTTLVLGVLLPFLGLSLLLVLILEHWVFPLFPKASNFLGLRR